MIRVRGRNGWFNFSHAHAFVGQFENREGGLTFGKLFVDAYIDIFSSSPHTRTPPVSFHGPPLEVVRLLRQMAREPETDYRQKKGGPK